MKAIVSYDLTKYFDEDLENLVRRVKAKLLIIVSESDMMVNSKNAIKFAEYSNSEILVLKNNCGHMGVNCEMEKVKKIINNFLSENK
jgi:homoserine O-acetyltransferase